MSIKPYEQIEIVTYKCLPGIPGKDFECLDKLRNLKRHYDWTLALGNSLSFSRPSWCIVDTYTVDSA